MSILIEIYPDNLEGLEKFCSECGDEFNSYNVNNHIEEFLNQSFNSLNHEKERETWKEKDDIKYAELELLAESEGIILPSRILFENSDSLRGYLIMKMFVNDLAIEKVCKNIQSIGVSIDDLVKSK